AFGIAPAVAAGRHDLVSGLKGASAAVAPRTSTLRSALVVTQIAVSLVAVVVAALFVRTLQNLRTVNPGYDVQEIFYVQMKLRPAGYSEIRGAQFYNEIVQRIRAVPGVRAATLANSMPPGWMWGLDFELQSRPLRSGERPLQAGKNTVGPGYFETLGARFVAGRGFNAGDTEKSPRVAVINETMARQFWPGESALGKRFRRVAPFGPHPWIEVVGIARDGKYEYLGEPARAHILVPFTQNYEPNMKIVVRATNIPLVMPAVSREILAFDPNLPAPQLKTAVEHLSESLANERVNASAISLSGLLTLLLTAVGLFGVVSFTVAQRTREIGIRVALGARPADVVRPMMSEGVRLIAAGLAAGVLMALGAVRLLASSLYGLGAVDAVSFGGGAALLAGVTLLACWLPARRALRVDPIEALRCE
ncbi:MAG TPA: FtsX-like permease family protein, partial [Bryobacteraceae bacterium]|nr:FtsX-like permease family protein [Bryobacteraceae bacterium]